MYHYLQILRYGSLNHPLQPGLRLPLYGFFMYHYLQIPRYGSLNHPLQPGLRLPLYGCSMYHELEILRYGSPDRPLQCHLMGAQCTTNSKFSVTDRCTTHCSYPARLPTASSEFL